MPTYRPGPASLILAVLVALFLLLPLLAVIPVSLTPSRMLAMPTGELSLRHYRALIEDPRWIDAILLSIRIGIVSSAISTVLALCFSLGVWMFQPRFTAALVGFVLLPMVVPPVVSAITLYFLLTSISGFSSFFGYDTWLGVAMAHSVMTVPFATVLILVSLSQLDRRIDLAARGLGASVWERATRIIMPNIKFGIVTAALLSFVLSWEEIGVTLFITVGQRDHAAAADVDGPARQHRPGDRSTLGDPDHHHRAGAGGAQRRGQATRRALVLELLQSASHGVPRDNIDPATAALSMIPIISAVPTTPQQRWRSRPNAVRLDHQLRALRPRRRARLRPADTGVRPQAACGRRCLSVTYC